MRPASVTLLVAAAIVAAVLGVGWTLQAAALPPPVRGELVAARAVSWLARYRFVASAFSVGGEPATHAQCRQGWFPVDTRHKEPGTVLHFGRHASVAALEGRKLAVRGVPHGEGTALASMQLELAGCARLLARDIAAALYSGRGIRIERADVADRPAIAFAVPLKHAGLRVYVTPRTYRPIALAVKGPRFDGRSRIRLTRLTPALAAAFDARG